jgi:hypothetical protein
MPFISYIFVQKKKSQACYRDSTKGQGGTEEKKNMSSSFSQLEFLAPSDPRGG